jgi:hypothetical protein
MLQYRASRREYLGSKRVEQKRLLKMLLSKTGYVRVSETNPACQVAMQAGRDIPLGHVAAPQYIPVKRRRTYRFASSGLRRPDRLIRHHPAGPVCPANLISPTSLCRRRCRRHTQGPDLLFPLPDLPLSPPPHPRPRPPLPSPRHTSVAAAAATPKTLTSSSLSRPSRPC